MSENYQTIKTIASNRKELVKAIATYTGEKAQYIGPPASNVAAPLTRPSPASRHEQS